ncbi:MAG: preprotein translocase subunit YajC [Ruminococcaceae bacterium]|nr:preprotein translocase subunit YajC [Oscillospiraceae bacterium]
MLHFFAETTAAPTTNPTGSIWPTIIMLVGMVLVFYFFIIRPQKKQDKAMADMRNSLAVGDEIVTIGGIIGTVLIIKDDKVMIETGNDRSKLTILRNSIKTVLKDDEDTQNK